MKLTRRYFFRFFVASALCLFTVMALLGANKANAQAEKALSGYLQYECFAGAPNYESVKRGDQKECFWILVSKQKIYIELEQQKTDISRVQIFNAGVPVASWKQLKVGARIAVAGELFLGHTGHHHTAAVLGVTSFFLL